MSQGEYQRKVKAMEQEQRAQELFHICGSKPEDAQAFKSLYRSGDEQVFDSDGYNVLHMAAEHGQLEILQHLIECGVDVNTPNKTNLNKPVVYGVYGGVKALEMLLKAGASTEPHPDAGDKVSALHRAAENNDGCIELLCEAGADVHAVDINGMTALHSAACCFNLEACKALIHHGADSDAMDDYGRTARGIYAPLASLLIANEISSGIEPETTKAAKRNFSPI